MTDCLPTTIYGKKGRQQTENQKEGKDVDIVDLILQQKYKSS